MSRRRSRNRAFVRLLLLLIVLLAGLVGSEIYFPGYFVRTMQAGSADATQPAGTAGADAPAGQGTPAIPGERAFAVSKPGGDDDRGRRAFFAGRGDDAGDRLRRRRDHQQIRCRSQLVDGLDGFDPLDLAVMRIDQTDRSFEPGGVFASGVKRRCRSRSLASSARRWQSDLLASVRDSAE